MKLVLRNGKEVEFEKINQIISEKDCENCSWNDGDCETGKCKICQDGELDISYYSFIGIKSVKLPEEQQLLRLCKNQEQEIKQKDNVIEFYQDEVRKMKNQVPNIRALLNRINGFTKYYPNNIDDYTKTEDKRIKFRYGDKWIDLHNYLEDLYCKKHGLEPDYSNIEDPRYVDSFDEIGLLFCAMFKLYHIEELMRKQDKSSPIPSKR